MTKLPTKPKLVVSNVVLNAEITTAIVEIRTMTINRKQMTLSVFRQLPNAQLINRDGSLNGTPWGVVNYHPDSCSQFDQHLHVIWQRGAELLRSHVWIPQTEGCYLNPDLILRREFPDHFRTDNGDKWFTLSIYRAVKEAGELPVKSEDAYELETLQQVKVVEKLSKLKFHSYRELPRALLKFVKRALP